jgi:hypothetical protein
MADDDQNKHDLDDEGQSREDGLDPWADLESEATPNLTEGFSFSFDESTAESSADDDLASAWLDEPRSGNATGEQQLAVFAPDDFEDAFVDDVVSGPVDHSSIEIGTGESGIAMASDIDDSGMNEPEVDVLGLIGDGRDESSAVDGEPVPDAEHMVAEQDGAPADGNDLVDFGIAAAATATAVASGGAVAAGDSVAIDAAADQAVAKPGRKGGFGQLVGVLLGGILAIPVTLAILIWGLKQDPLNITRQVPESLAFLVPAEFRKAARPPVTESPDLSAAASLADLPTADDAGSDVGSEQAPVGHEVAVAEPAAAEPIADHGIEEHPVEESAAVAPETAAAAEPISDEAVAAVESPAPPAADAAVEPSSDDVAALVTPAELALQAIEPPPVAPQPEPLDLSGIESATADAMLAVDAVKASADTAGQERTRTLVEWYKSLARVAEELAMLERVAADSGTPLEETPTSIVRLYHDIASRPELLDDLARLSRNWLGYAKRAGDGVVIPATLAETRPVGPYWCSRVALAEAGGRARELAVISRSEPVAHAGDLLLLTGLVLDGDVIWAADIRPAVPVAGGVARETQGGADPFVPAEPDAFGVPLP